MVHAEQIVLPHPVLPSANWADCYSTVVRPPPGDALEVCRELLSRQPFWFRQLLALRNRLVRLVGLKSEEPALSASSAIGMFPVVRRSADQVVLGFDDRHLDFRIVVDIVPVGNGGSKVALTTLVDRHGLSGRLYILLVTPFHKLIVRTQLARYAKRSALDG